MQFRTSRNFLLLFTLLIMAIVVTAPAFAQAPPRPQPNVTSIEKLKSIDLKKLTAKTLRQQYVVKGYFVTDPVPMIVKDLKYLRINTPMPESAFILVKGKGVDRLLEDKSARGALVQVKGTLVADREITKGKLTHVLQLPTTPIIIRKGEFSYGGIVNLCKLHPEICKFPPFQHRHFALLYSGGVNSYNAHGRYWNDLKFMYMTLRSKGFTDANIVVVYKDGVGADSDMPVDYAASATGLNDAVKYLRSHMTANDDFFVFVTNHGGGYHDSSCSESPASWGGRTDAMPGDEINANIWDEQIYYYNQTANNLFDDDFATTINSLNFKRMVAVFEQCFSGGFLRDLRGSNRILISAATDSQFSWAMGPSYTYDTFSYHFTSALNGKDPSGAALATSPDTDGDGKVSILEAFLYAKSKDTDCETPWLEDDSDGVGSNTPTATGTNGKLAATTFF